MLKVLIKKEILQFKRNSFLPKLVVMFPIMIMLVLPWVTTMDVRHVNVSVIDNDHSQISTRIIDKINSSEYLTLHSITSSFDLSMRELEKGDVDAILEIPQDYEKTMLTGYPKRLSASANSVNSIKGSLGLQYLVQTINKAVAEQRASATPVKIGEPVTIQNRYNPTLEYRNFMIPALLIILMIIITGFLPALNFVSEKEIGTIEQINVTPVSRFSFTLAKLIVYWGAGLIVITIALLVAWIVYGLSAVGSLAVIYAGAFLFILTISGFGIIASNISSTMQQAIFFMFFFVMVFMLMSGLLTPIESMPQWAQYFTYLLPPRYFISIMRSVFLKGATFYDMRYNFLALAILAIIMNVGAALTYKKQN
ncbi:MAG: ABC transporter permease [Muribaculaceae bacterium]|nr:ABC transporter permease [Muribaculaceae bacterium]